ncbi:MAG: flagellar hook-associated protein 3 [Actinomycetales bacterium]|nr:flagellar hook-associated protein 3 [Actinomycetales bacterium]
MISRVTHQTVQRSTLANLQVNLSRIADLQGRLSGGKVITKPSDDPAGTASALRLRGDLRVTQQYQRNADDGVGWLTTVDASLQASVTALRQVRNLVVQGASTGASGPVPRAAIAAELEGLRDALLEQANSTYLGRPVFAGTTSAGHAYEVTPGDPPTYEWLGHEAGSVQRRVGPATTVRADSDGRLAFGDGDDSVFALIDRIVAELRAEDGEVGHFLADIDVRMEKMLAELADVGARYKQLTAAQVATEEAMVGLKGQIAAIEDIDLAEALVELQSQEVAYQAALGATARVLQPSLLDFIR